MRCWSDKSNQYPDALEFWQQQTPCDFHTLKFTKLYKFQYCVNCGTERMVMIGSNKPVYGFELDEYDLWPADAVEKMFSAMCRLLSL